MIKIVITRPLDGAKDTIDLAQQMGFKIFAFPLLSLSTLMNVSTQWQITDYNWILFTSSNAVRFFMNYCSRSKIYFTQNIKIAAVGPGTEKTLNNIGLNADFVPATFNRTAVSEQMPVNKGELVLYPTLLDGPTRIENILNLRGCKVDRVDIYKSDPIVYSKGEWQKLESRKPDVITFFSPRTVQAYFKKEQQSLELKKYTIAVLAKSSEEELIKHGHTAHIRSDVPTPNNLLNKIIEYYA